ncbi:MAG: DUF4931 domain-containing protein [Candidatus Diapherotrites archaeon]|nr:DUF4931 domain-containing protein [Candidatus Diapherotrites archaeon]
MHNDVINWFGREVVVATGRSGRPRLFSKPLKVCPFCPGNEHMTPPETGRVEREGKWILRSFENKYPIVSKDFPKAYGRHEIIVETPIHSQKLQETDVLAYLKFAFKRMEELNKDEKINYVLLFKNHGSAAGASIPHEHSQITSLTEIPPKVSEELESFKSKGCPICESKYVLFENDGAKCIVPEAPIYPYELWIAPKEHTSTKLSHGQLKYFADALKDALRKLDKLLGNPDYCFYLHYYPEENEWYHLHLEITPRISRWGGFELGSGMIVNTIPPERAMEELSKV